VPRRVPSPSAWAPWRKNTAWIRCTHAVCSRRRSWQAPRQRPGLQDLFGRELALREPALGQQPPQVPGVGPVGLGVPLAAAGERGAGRPGQVHADPGGGQLRGDIPPPGTALDRERGITAPAEPGQPGPQVLPDRRRDLPAAHLPGHGAGVVEGQLLPVNIDSAYHGHRDLLKLPRATP
jgi:hypothetical protein